jgi:hypothetical protein
MIAMIKLGSGFRGTLDYLLSNKGREAEVAEHAQKWGEGAHTRDFAKEYEEGARYRVIGGNMGGQTPRELAREFGSFRRLRPDIEKPVHHASLSAAKGDTLSVEQWNEIAAKYVERMGFEDSPYVVIQHRDTEHDHVHIVTSRVDVNERVVNEWQNKPRAEKLMREVEQEYDLERVPLSRDVARAAPTRGEIERFNRTGELSAKMSLQSYVEQALKDAPTTDEFIERLGRSGVEVLPNIQSTGRVSGISFLHDGRMMKGSDLGRGFSWGGLQKRGLDYDSKRDNKTLKETLKRVSEAHRLARGVGEVMERTAGQTAKEIAVEVAKAVGKHYLNQLNPLNPYIQYYKLGRDAVRATKAVSDYLRTPAESPAPVESPAPAGEQLPAEAVKLTEKEAVEQLRESAGMPRVQDANDALNRLRDEAKQPDAGQEQKPEPKQETEGETGRESGREAEQKLESETEREAAEELETETAETAGEEVALEETVAEEAIDILLL